jgi:riboflavin synthase alpha subunit
VTTLGELTVGAGANIEIDVIARYLDRLTQPFAEPRKDPL